MSRKEKKYHLIYKTTNLLSGKYYLGMHSTDNLNDGYMGSGKRLKYSINKYGKENHKVEILEFIETRELLVEREKEIVTLNELAKIKCINLRVGGDGGFSSEEHKNNFTKAGNEAYAFKLKNDKLLLIEHLVRFKKIKDKARLEGKISKIYEYYDWTDKEHSEETKQLMSDIRLGTGTGETNSQYGTCWITKDNENKKINKEDLDKWINEGWVKGRITK